MPRIVEVPDEFLEGAWELFASMPGGSAFAATTFARYNVPTPQELEKAPDGTYRWAPPSRTSIPLTLLGAGALFLVAKYVLKW